MELKYSVNLPYERMKDEITANDKQEYLVIFFRERQNPTVNITGIVHPGSISVIKFKRDTK